ncbi:MAG: hypothetical protein NTU58_03010 [Candidatus Nealsonbacteria bacterium]|nr:hypothetical protein [Candidatus Nealsonbacteria bacterium]
MEKINDILNKKKWRPKLDSLDGLPIRPSVKRTRLYLDNEYFEKGYGALFPHSVTTVYCILARRARHETQICYPAAQDIMGLGGITNRNTIFKAFKILEAYDILAIVRRSKGRVPNVYALLDSSHWKPINSINFETVMDSIRKKRTVSKTDSQQLQNQQANSGTDDTRSHITKSDNEISEKIKKISIKGTELLQRLSPIAKSVVSPCFSEDDIIGSLEELVAGGNKVEEIGYKLIIEALRRRGAIPIKELPSWLKI